jgi:hypothetical protein
VELLNFEAVDYWDEFCMIIDWAASNVYSTLLFSFFFFFYNILYRFISAVYVGRLKQDCITIMVYRNKPLRKRCLVSLVIKFSYRMNLFLRFNFDALIIIFNKINRDLMECLMRRIVGTQK